MKKYLLLTALILFLIFVVQAAMDPAPAFCQNQGYKYSSIYKIIYEGNPLTYKEDIKLGVIEIEYLNKIITIPIESTQRYIEGDNFRIDRSKLNLRDRTDYCIFDDGNKCEAWDFFEGKCGSAYRKGFPCKPIGEIVFPQFEKCCEGKSYLHYAFVGQPSCQPLSKRLIGNIRYNPFFQIIAFFILVILIYLWTRYTKKKK